MKRMMLIITALLLTFVSIGFSQIPGDFNCSGQVNALDWSYLVNIARSGLIDSTTCTWRNGDMNGDTLNHTIADWWQWQLMASGDTLDHNPPLPYDLDSIIIGEGSAAPGEFAVMPIMVNLAEPAFGISLQFVFNADFLYNPQFSLQNGYLENCRYELNGGNLYLYDFPNENSHQMPAGQYLIAYMALFLRENTPIDTTLTVELVAGDYYPSGFANISYPTYFIRPVLIGGTIHVTPTGIDDNTHPEILELNLANYPNPFNAQTSIEYALPKSDFVSITVYDLLGRKTVTLVDGFQSAGPHSVLWDASSQPSGIYFYKIQAGELSETKKMTLLK